MKRRWISVLVIILFLLAEFIFSQVNSNNSDLPEVKHEIRCQDDYYEYTNGDLLNDIELTGDQAEWTWFSELSAVCYTDMKNIISTIVDGETQHEKGSSEQKIKDLYLCAKNTQNRNQTGLGPLLPHFNKIKDAKNIDEYVDALSVLSGQFGFSSLIGGYYIDQDKMDSTKNSVYLMYADTLIGKEYLEDESMSEYVDMYYEYVESVLMECGMSKQKAHQVRNDIDNLARQICESTMSLEKYMDPVATYNVFDKEGLQKLLYNIDVDKMLKTLKIDSAGKYIVIDVEQAKKVNALLNEDNLETLKYYSMFVMLKDAAKYSTEELAKLDDDIYNKLNGITDKTSEEYLWTEVTMDMLPWDFGKIYVEKYFSEKKKEDIENIIKLIVDEYKLIISRQEWMSEATKNKAIKKLETMNVKIGYPDKWPDSMERMKVTSIEEGGSLLSNMLENMHVGIEEELLQIGKDYDKSSWHMTPQEVNAYYDPGNNEIVFPASILQAPFYDEENEVAANLGGIGFVIAHEISHAFDSNGAKYDETGNVNLWWTEEELEEYERLSQAIIDYYNGYKLLGRNVNGELTLSENIADLGALTCITSIIGDDKEELDKAFSQMAYIWATQSTASHQLNLLSTDSHSPNKVRVNATLSSCDAFYETYDVKETDAMYVKPELRVGIWK